MATDSAATDGFLARVYCAPAAADRLSAPPPPDDLLLALTRASLRVFARKARDLGCACFGDAGDALLASGFHCPHVRGADDYWPAGIAVDMAAIRQVLVTYRSAGGVAQTETEVETQTETEADTTKSETDASRVATRTRDCVLVFVADGASPRRVRLEFEHNLARGAFVDAVTAATDGQVEVDYVDALGLDEEETAPADGGNRGLSPRGSVGTTPGDARAFDERRAALRAVVARKISLALQLAVETAGDPGVQLLLGSATALAQALDEPDELALAWLVSGFINARRALPSDSASAVRSKKVATLALAQLQHAAKLAREHCLPPLLALTLQCSADLLVSSVASAVDVGEALGASGDRWKLDTARKWLTEAARLLPREADATLKMQLHRKIGDLAAVVAARASLRGGVEASEAVQSSEKEATRSSHSDLATNALDISALLLDSPGASSPQPQPFGGLAWLLSPPLKRADDQCKPNIVCVRVMNPFAAGATDEARGDARPPQPEAQRLRVFFTAESDIEWLQQELTRRLRACPPPFLAESDTLGASNGGGGVNSLAPSLLMVRALFDSPDGSKRDGEALPLVTKLRAVVASDGHVLTAQVALETETQEEERAEDTLTVLCSQCHARVALEDVEAHSEVCC